VEQAIKKNTELFNGMGIESVPYIMAKNSRTGQLVTNSGALSTQALADFLGVD
jgi:thiol:disulfide interchange protein DsbG